MKKYFFSFLLLAFHTQGFAKEVPLGKETIKPLKYPKFSIASDYSLGNQFILLTGDKSLSHEINDSIGFSLISEAGLLKYFNAGFIFNFSSGNNFPEDLVVMRMQLYAKPYFPITERIAIFSRIGLGPSIDIPASGPGSSIDIYQISQFLDIRRHYPSIIGGVGLNGSITAGMEFFPLSRLGISFEAGIKSDIIWRLLKETPMRMGEDGNFPPSGAGDDYGSINYLTFGFPLMLNLNFIL